MLRNQPQASMERMALSGNASLITTVEASGALRLRTGRSLLTLLSTLPRLGDSEAKRSKLNLTSSVVKARPLVGGRGSSLLFGRSLSVTVIRSGETSNEDAASGSTAPSGGVKTVPSF